MANVGMRVDRVMMVVIRAKLVTENEVESKYPQIVFLNDMTHVTSMLAVQNSVTVTPPNSSKHASTCNGVEDSANMTSSPHKSPFIRASLTMS